MFIFLEKLISKMVREYHVRYFFTMFSIGIVVSLIGGLLTSYRDSYEKQRVSVARQVALEQLEMMVALNGLGSLGQQKELIDKFQDDHNEQIEDKKKRVLKIRKALSEIYSNMKKLDGYNAAVANSHSSFLARFNYLIFSEKVNFQGVSSEIVCSLDELKSLVSGNSDTELELYGLLEGLYISTVKESEGLERDSQCVSYYPYLTAGVYELVEELLVEIEVGE